VPARFGTFGIANGKRVVPRDPERSVLLRRIRAPNRARMPPLGAFTYDAHGASLVEMWIRNLDCE
jgi:hypothetical protein